jgi:imidazole glycerol-phosphate synthase subunit HisH
MIAIIDYGMGNIASVLNMLKRIDVRNVKLTKDIREISNADKIILPGVGSFDNGMINLKNTGLIEILNKKVLTDKIPVLGICLGMQLLTNGSEEGKEKGLGWIDASTVKFKFNEGSQTKIPHMGWNYISPSASSNLLRSETKQKFYFVHSYYVKCNKPQDIAATCKYETEFTCAVEHENIFGVQFHPEKSHKFGMHLFEKFNKL